MCLLKEEGPEIFVQSHSLIVPSGSLELLPSSNTLSVGKVITWSGPAVTVGGLLFSLPLSHDLSFLPEINMTTPASNNVIREKKILFITKDLMISKLKLPHLVE